MDILYCKTQLAWVVQNANDAQHHLDTGDMGSVAHDLALLERAVQRVRDELARGKQP